MVLARADAEGRPDGKRAGMEITGVRTHVASTVRRKVTFVQVLNDGGCRGLTRGAWGVGCEGYFRAVADALVPEKR